MICVLSAQGTHFAVVFKELGTASGGLGPPGSASSGDDWQQLHLAPFEGIAETSGDSPLAIKVSAGVCLVRGAWGERC